MLSHVDLTLPDLPPALEGLTIAHVTDLHIDRRRRRHNHIIAALERIETDLALFTGDYMDWPGDEAVALEVMREVVAGVRARYGAVGVFGNHDTPRMQEMLSDLPVTWLCDDRWRPPAPPPPELPLEVLGVDASDSAPGDAVALLARMHGGNGRPDPGVQRPLRLLLSHFPMYLPTASDLGVDIMFSGHTHGGQCRVPPRRALTNSSDLPIRLTSGILRHRHTLCVVSRGLGESVLPLRLFCPPHIPVYTLHHGPMAGVLTPHMENLQPW